ncbi:MAG: cytochrome c oxidase assembly protein [Micavibrio aeruginosavorus]|uniref:Cytochrome c oxidase assembly protein CtaG n=1 Tax=Micavibrio aeruginosavorus TaxID=349221 RepID=A0A2W5PU13_9BACT|nr:MAG: cytochrome c oxidase assembly protein [Micavibrio aeruginosavorus]
MDKNTKTISLVFLVVAFMVGLAFASVPLYRAFCQLTGFGGTTMKADKLPDQIIDRKITIKFDTNTSNHINWDFKPEKYSEDVKLGQQGLISFIAKNKDRQPSAGTALFNVTPNKAGAYFHKIQCFCFAEQLLQPGEEMRMPVVFYVDPKMNDDHEMEDVQTITLSYTFFPAESEELDKALEAFYNTPKD